MTTDPLAPFDPINGMPVTIVFGTFNYRDIIHKWIDHALSSCDHWRIVCVDKELFNWLHEIGYGANAVYFFDIFSDASPDFNKLQKKRKKYAVLPTRQKLWCALAESGRDFINSDADAFWLRDIRPWLKQHADFDILISQGTTKPRSFFTRYRFVLCAGFFYCRANARTQAYFRRVEAMGCKSDQKPINEVLLQDTKARWKTGWSTVMSFERWHKEWNKTPPLVSIILMLIQRLPHTWQRRSSLLKRIKKRLLHKHNYAFTSSKIIRGRFSNGLTIGVIPMHLVTRVYHPFPSPFIIHTSGNKKGWDDGMNN